MTDIAFTTPHGSRLYGFAHAGSDYDTFTVVTNPKQPLRQVIHGDEDRVTVGWMTWLHYAMRGSHQSCEALFSQQKEWHDETIRPLVDAMRITGPDVSERYSRTIRKFCYGDFKRRRHAVRLYFNLDELRHDGYFNPTLNEWQVDTCTRYANRYDGDYLATLLGVKQ